MWHDSYIHVTCLIHMWHDLFICYRHIHMWRYSFICDMIRLCVTWLIHMWHDSFICDMTHSYVTWLIHIWHGSCICDMTHSCVDTLFGSPFAFSHAFFALFFAFCRALSDSLSRSLIPKSTIVRGHFISICILIGARHTGWPRPIVCLKLQVIFRKRAL